MSESWRRWLGLSREVIEAFDSVADGYDQWYEEPLGRYVLRAELKALGELLPSAGVGADVGGGTGVFTAGLRSGDRVVLCLDPALRMLERARLRGVDVVAGIAELPPLREGSLDFAYMVAALEFVRDPLRALTGIRGALKPLAPLVLMIINRDSPWGQSYMEAGERGDPIFRHARFYTLGEALSLLRRAGFDVDRVVGALPDPPAVIPRGEPRLLAPETAPSCGVFFVRAIVRAASQA